MQTIINNQPVWITQGIEPNMPEILEGFGFTQTALASDLESNDFLDIAMRIKEYTDGWWFASCHPGCMPDSDFAGPYKTEDEAYKAAVEWYNAD